MQKLPFRIFLENLSTISIRFQPLKLVFLVVDKD